MVTIKVNERTKNGKSILEMAKKFSLENKSVIIQDDEMLSIEDIVLECRKARKKIAINYNAK